MKRMLSLHFAFLSMVLFVGCSSHRGSSCEPARGAAVTDKEEAVAIVITPRSASWKLADVQYFDVVVKNPTPNTIKVPYIYDSFVEIDGELHTQFPKPKLTGETKRVIQGNSDASAGTVTLNGPFSTVDAKTGKIPLKLRTGIHTLVLVCGPYRSERVTFEIIE